MSVFRHAFESDGDEAGKIEVTGRVIRTTTKAILLDDGVSQNWLPLSKIKLGPEDKAGIVPVFMPQWLAKEKKYI